MTTRSRRSGGQAAKATPEKPAAEQTKAEPDAPEQAEQPAAAAEPDPAPAKAEQADAPEQADADAEQPDAEDASRKQAADDGTAEKADEPARATAIPGVAGDPVPAEVDKAFVLDETGISPEPFTGTAPTAATELDQERNGGTRGELVDRTGELRQGPVTTGAPTGDSEANGKPLRTAGVTDRTFGGNGDPQAKLAGGTLAYVGAGTPTPDIGPDERPTYPSTTLTRSSSSATPMEPEDVRHVTEPKLGVVEASTDPIAAAAVISSLPGDVMTKLVDRAGNEVKPSEFFEVPDGPMARSLRVVKHRVSEVYTTRAVKTPGQRLLFTEGQEVPVHIAEQLIALHG